MGKKLGLLSLALCFICSLAFAEDTAPVEKKDAKANKTASAQKAQPVKMQMPEMPTLDPKVWDFLPETVAVVGDIKISKEELV